MNKDLKKLFELNRNALINSDKDLKAVFEIMFSNTENIMCEGNDGFRIYKYTYGEMKEKIRKTAAAIYKKIGAKHSYIALEMENGPEWIISFWSILMSGNKPYLVNTRYPETLSNGILKTLGIKNIICLKNSKLDADSLIFSSLGGDFSPVPEEIFENEIAFSSSATSMNEVICFYTGLQISEQILNFKDIVKENPRMAKHYKGSLKQLAFLPFYHIFGLFAVYFWFTFFGRTLVFLRDYSAETILKTCKRHKVTHIFAVPVLWHTVEKQLWSTVKEQDEAKEKKLRKALKLMTGLQNIFPSFGAAFAKWALREVTDRLFGNSVMFCINGGSYVTDSALELFNGLGYCLHNGYGMSEIGITSVELRKKAKERNLNSIGKPFSSVEYKLNDKNILLVKGSSLCVRKLVNGKEVILSDWFETGDNMEIKDGYYYILGRVGDVVIGENGENINPDTVEKFFRLPNTKALSVLGIEGENGEELSLIAEISPFATEKTVSAIKNEAYAINETFSSANAVKKFYFTFDELMPPNAIKISRTQLTRKIKENAVKLIPFADIKLNSASSGETTPLQKEVISIIAKALDVETDKIGPDTHIFYDLGATSIQYFSVISELSQRFSISQYDDTEKYCYTPKEICEYLERFL